MSSLKPSRDVFVTPFPAISSHHSNLRDSEVPTNPQAEQAQKQAGKCYRVKVQAITHTSMADKGCSDMPLSQGKKGNPQASKAENFEKAG